MQSNKLGKTIIEYLKKANKLDLLPSLVDTLKNSPEYKKSQHQVIVTSATKLEASVLNSIESYAKKVVGSDYILSTKINEELIAGFTLQIDDQLTDVSVLGKVNKIHATLNAKE